MQWTRIVKRRSGSQFKETKKRLIKYRKEVVASDCRFFQLRETVATLPGTSYFGVFYNPARKIWHVLYMAFGTELFMTRKECVRQGPKPA